MPTNQTSANTSTLNALEIKSLGHHGIVAGFIDKLKLVERIDERLPLSKAHGSKLSHGKRLKAMIINGLGFTQNPIYLTQHFFEDKALTPLLGDSVCAEHLNDDALGRTLDACYEYGVTELFAELANEVNSDLHKDNSIQTLHLDTTSLKLTGDYAVEDAYIDESNPPPLPKLGYSKDHRPDLKQLVLSLTVSGPADIPVWFEGLDGNSQDKRNFHETLANIKAFKESLKQSSNFVVVADSALYVTGKLAEASYTWITRVPERLTLVKTLVESNSTEFAWEAIGDGYRGVLIEQTVQGLEQRWALIHSEQAEKRERASLSKRIEKAEQEANKAAKKLMQQDFACEKDAEKAAKAFNKGLKYHQAAYQISPITKHTKRGRPSKEAQPEIAHYQVILTIEACHEKRRPLENKLGRFVLATNDIDNSEMDAACLLSTYKSQQGVERGFRFIKDPQFHLNGIFLKKPERIHALMMLMSLCLMVYNVGQFQLRENIKECNETVLNQVGKPITNPTMRWVYQRMNGINYVGMPGLGYGVNGLTEEQAKIIKLCGEEVARIYQLS